MSLTIVATCAFSEGTQAQQASIQAVTGATVIDGTGRGPIKDAVIVIEDDRITRVGPASTTAIPTNARIIPARERFIIPGLADMHNHLNDGTLRADPQDQLGNLGQLLAWGVTLVFDPGLSMKSFDRLRQETRKPGAPYPRFYGVGRLFGAKGGWGSFQGGYTPETPEEARADVRQLKAANVDAVKLVYDDMSHLVQRPLPALRPELMAAIIDETHRQGLKAYVHAPILRYAKEALRAGADGLLHGVLSDPVDDEFVALMKQNHAVYVSTLTVFEACADVSAFVKREAGFETGGRIARKTYDILADSAPIQQAPWWTNSAYTKSHLPILRANLKRMVDAGVLVTTGTDAGVPGVLLGVSSQLELVLHVEAGVPPATVIRLATLNAARMIGRADDLGSIEAGKLADFIVLDGDPLADIRNVRRIALVVKGGEIRSPDAWSSMPRTTQDST